VQLKTGNILKFKKRIAFTINEFFESIGGLINAIEKLIMPFIVYFSYRLFWL